jgi:2-amino-4-hydroxy-6-hydroxymethyldihydropteridine diphosphokinase
MRTNGGKVLAYIGIGSNLGEREANIRKAIAALVQTPHLWVRKISSFIENPAVGGPEDAPDFLNAAVEIMTMLTAPTLMKKLVEIEHALGRQRRVKWEPRPIDLDLLLYSDSIISTDALIVPHPLMHERLFVIDPLAEIAPKAVHPTLNLTIVQIRDGLKGIRTNENH